MMPVPFELAASLLGLGAASGTRASLALLIVAAAGRSGWVEIPTTLSFVTSTPALGALVAATVLEEFLERDDDAQQLLAIVKYAVHGTGAVVVSRLLVEKFHLPLDGWPIAAIGGALAVLTHNVRMKLHDALRDLEAGIVTPRRWLTWLEVGGVVGLATAVLIAPMVAAVFALLAAVFCGLAGFLVGRIESAQRRPCPTCRMPVRKEARLCPHCREALPVARWVGSGLLSRVDRLGAKERAKSLR